MRDRSTLQHRLPVQFSICRFDATAAACIETSKYTHFALAVAGGTLILIKVAPGAAG